MTTYLFSQLTPGSTIAFDPSVDVLRFDDTSLSAARVDITAAADGLSYGISPQSVTLQSTSAWQPASRNFSFADGSQLLFASADSASLTGGSQADQLNGTYLAGSTLAGGSGNDLYLVDGSDDLVVEAAYRGTDTVRSSVSYVLGANVENLELTGSAHLSGTGNSLNNSLVGNSGDNTLEGGAGDDTLNGGAGIDRLTGGSGNDTYHIDRPEDVIVEEAGGGIDTIHSRGSYTLGSVFENLFVYGQGTVGRGNDLDNVLKSYIGANLLEGGAGNDTLWGSSGSFYERPDTLAGGTGNDTYRVAATGGNLILEDEGAGIDTVVVLSSDFVVDYTLEANVENLTLSGYNGSMAGVYLGGGTGNELDNRIEVLGGTRTFVLLGEGGHDTLLSSAGNDWLDGGSGNDLLDGQAGLDRLQGGDGDDHLQGGADKDLLYGGAGEDRLDGGTDQDYLAGGAGNDRYWVDNSGDKVFEESAAGGIDTVYFRANSGAGSPLGQHIENMQFIGTGNFSATGNELDNRITGGAGNDFLRGEAGNDTLIGGAGADLLWGGAGNDHFVIDNVGDGVLGEDAGSGIDTVHSSFSYWLQSNLENLMLTGSAALSGTGNGLDNLLYGNGGDNTLSGGAGNDWLDGGSGGLDVLSGGSGNDRFVLRANAGAEQISDFVSGSDKLCISWNLSKGLGAAVGDGDSRVEGSALSSGPGGFAVGAELVVFTRNIAGALSADSAAAAIGSASSAYASGATRVFAVDNGSSSAVYLFTSSGNDAQVSASELRLLATLEGTAATSLADYQFLNLAA